MSNLFRLGYQKWHLLLNVKIALMVMLHEGSPYGSSPLLFIITFFLPFLFCWYCYILCILICRRQSCSCQQWRNSKWILRYIIDGMKCNDFSGTCWTPLNGCHQQSTGLSPFISADLNMYFIQIHSIRCIIQIGPRKLDFRPYIATPLCVTHFYTFQTRILKFYYDEMSYAIF